MDDKSRITVETEKTLRAFPVWLYKNYSAIKGGWRHKGDFYRNDKPIKLESIIETFIAKAQKEEL